GVYFCTTKVPGKRRRKVESGYERSETSPRTGCWQGTRSSASAYWRKRRTKPPGNWVLTTKHTRTTRSSGTLSVLQTRVRRPGGQSTTTRCCTASLDPCRQ